jgi:hypothetical protein
MAFTFIFFQKEFVCNWWFKVDCSQARSFYYLNEEVKAEQLASEKRLKMKAKKAGGCF